MSSVKDKPVKIRIRTGGSVFKILLMAGVAPHAACQMLGKIMNVLQRIPGYACTRSRNQIISGWWIPRSTFTILDPQRKKKTNAKPSERRA